MLDYRDVTAKSERHLSLQVWAPLLSVSMICLWMLAFAARPETAMAGSVSVSVSVSSNGAVGCSYGGLIPGGYFQGTDVPSPPAPMPVPCMTDSESDQEAFAVQSFIVHPGLSGEHGLPTSGGGIAVPAFGQNSFVGAWAANGGGGYANSIIYYEVFDTQTGLIDTNVKIAMTFNAGVSVGTDGFEFYNNAGYDAEVGPGLGSTQYAQVTGGLNDQNGASFCTYQDNTTLTLGVSLNFPDCQADITIQTSGIFVLNMEAYANETSVAWLDPSFTPLNPDDVLIASPFEGDPNTPLFTAAQLAEFQSFDIDISGIPSSTVQSSTIPEPSTGPLFASGFVLFAVAAFIRARFAKC